MSKIDLERITWIDSGMHFATGWHSLETVRERASEWDGTSNTVGYVVFEDDEVVCLAQTLEEDKANVAGAWTVYKPCITERVVLESKEWKHG